MLLFVAAIINITHKYLACKYGIEVRSFQGAQLEVVRHSVERIGLVGTVHQPDYDDHDHDADDHHHDHDHDYDDDDDDDDHLE